MRQMNAMDKGIYYPSFAFEKKTKAFNKYIWAFVSLVTLLPIMVFVFGYVASFMFSYLDLVSTVIHDNLWVFMMPVYIFIGLSYQFVQFLLIFRYSYKFENGKIIKGVIQNAAAKLSVDSSVGEEVAAEVMDLIDVPDSTADNFGFLLHLISLNTNPKFVKTYFDTEYYKKKVYENPRLVKTTKYALIYTCDNKKRLVIPKIYEGMCDPGNGKESSFIGRILTRSAYVFTLTLALTIVDLLAGCVTSDTYVNNQVNTITPIEQKLVSFGYKSEGLGSFSKELEHGFKRSKISYSVDKYGNLNGCSVQLYYRYDSENVEEELRYIISTIHCEFDQDEVDDFIESVKEMIAGNYRPGKLKGKSERYYALTLGKSDGYVDIHSY